MDGGDNNINLNGKELQSAAFLAAILFKVESKAIPRHFRAFSKVMRIRPRRTGCSIA